MIFDLDALALTPIHVGDGSTWTPESFKLEGQELLRFEPTAVVAGFDTPTRKRFLEAIGRGDLPTAQRLIRGAVEPEQVLERIKIGDSSSNEIEQAVNDPERRGDIHPFIRSGGRPFLPGSAVKGAIRTALLSARMPGPRLSAWKEKIDREIAERPNRKGFGQLSNELQSQVLELGRPQATDTDPFRFVAVGDADLPKDHTRIDRVYNFKRDGSMPDGGMQMHFETMPAGCRLAMRIKVDVEFVRRAATKAAARADSLPTKPIEAVELFSAVDDFYRRRWRADADRFFTRHALPNFPSAREGWPVLLRVGRFSHFESASVEGLRRTPQRLPGGDVKMVSEGSTRGVVAREGDGAPLPFGWILLIPKERAAELDVIAAELARVASRSSVQADTRRRADGTDRPAPVTRQSGAARPRTLAGSRGTYEGEAVEILNEVKGPSGKVERLYVRFLADGSSEEIPLAKFILAS